MSYDVKTNEQFNFKLINTACPDSDTVFLIYKKNVAFFQDRTKDHLLICLKAQNEQQCKRILNIHFPIKFNVASVA